MDAETFRWVVELALLGLAGVLWYLMRKLIGDLRDLEKDLSAYKLHVAEKFVTQADLTKAIDNFAAAVREVFRKLERIDDKLDKKADK